MALIRHLASQLEFSLPPSFLPYTWSQFSIPHQKWGKRQLEGDGRLAESQLTLPTNWTDLHEKCMNTESRRNYGTG